LKLPAKLLFRLVGYHQLETAFFALQYFNRHKPESLPSEKETLRHQLGRSAGKWITGADRV
jgi:hypothetical protein